MHVPKRVVERFKTGLRRMVPIIQQQRERDVSEADTVTLVKDLLSEVFGFDKWAEVTGEFAIRGTYCDLAIKLDERVVELIEVKAIGITLDDRHLRQGVNYAANKGVEWVILSNAAVWQLYKVIFAKPIDKKLVLEIDLTKIDANKPDDQESLFILSKEGFLKGAHVQLCDRQEALSRYTLAALLLNNRRVLHTVRRELRRVVDINAGISEIADVLRQEVVKRDAQEDPKATEAVERVRKAQGSSILGRGNKKKQSDRTGRKDHGVTLSQLIDSGLLNAPMPLFRKYKGQRLDAELHGDGTIEFAGERFDNPSSAASAARATILGESKATNGWAFWRFRNPDGARESLSDARAQYVPTSDEASAGTADNETD